MMPVWLCLAVSVLLFPGTGGVWAAAGKDGKVSLFAEYPLPESVSAPMGIGVDAGGRVWFTEKIGKSLTMFDPDTRQFTGHALPDSWAGIGPLRIALNPGNGEIWFTVRRWADADVGTNLLGRYSPDSGRFDRFELPDGVVPEDLALAADGNVWFLNPDGNALHLFEPAEKRVTDFAVPTANGYPRQLVVDGRGDVWFALPNINRIGHFDAKDKTFREHEIPTPFANPGAMTVDGRGRVWFAELTANRIGVFYPDLQRFDEAMLPTPRGLPNAVAADDQGRVWFLEYRGNKVGLFEPDKGKFREYTIPTYDSQPGAIALDAGRGRLWFSEAGTESRKLGMLDIPRALATEPGTEEGDGAAADMAGHRHAGMTAGLEPHPGDMNRARLTWLIGTLVIIAGAVYLRRKARG